MDRHVNGKNSNLIGKRKLVPALDYEKFRHSFSEPVSLQNTPQSIKAAKLGPVGSSLSEKRTIEPRTPTGKNPKSQFSSISPTIFRASQKVWPSSNDHKEIHNPFRSIQLQFPSLLIALIRHQQQVIKVCPQFNAFS